MYPEVYEYTWSSVEYAASTTTEITVATLVVLIDDTTNRTSTSTEYSESTVPGGYLKPGATNEATLTFERLPGETITTVIPYPTPYFDYGSNYTIEGGQLFTQRTCKTYSQPQTYVPNRHPVLPTPASDYTTDKADPYGAFYTLVSADAPTYSDFPGFYTTAFMRESGVASCTPAALTSFVATTEEPSSVSAAPPANTSPLTHTSVSYLTATSTKHTSIPLDSTAQSDNAGKPTSASPPPSSSPAWTGPVIGGGNGYHTGEPATPTLVGTNPAIVVGGQTVTLGGGRVDVHGTPVRLTVYTTNGATETGAVVGYGGGAFGGAVQTTIPISFPSQPGPQISACNTQLEVTPTYISSTPMAVVSNVWLSVNGPGSEICGTPVRVTAVATTESGHPTTVTEALIGYGGGAFGGPVQSTVTLTWESALATETGKTDLGGYIASGLGGGGGDIVTGDSGSTQTSPGSGKPTSSEFQGAAAPPAATAASSGSMFGLVVAGVVGLLI